MLVIEKAQLSYVNIQLYNLCFVGTQKKFRETLDFTSWESYWAENVTVSTRMSNHILFMFIWLVVWGFCFVWGFLRCSLAK